jgi:hypothetical protein
VLGDLLGHAFALAGQAGVHELPHVAASPSSLSQLLRQEIEQFFSIYKDLEGKAGARGDRGRPGASARALTRGRSAARAGERQLLALLDKRDVTPRVGTEIDRVVIGLAGEALCCTR